MISISIKDVSIRFGVVQALKNVSFDIEEGHVVALCGENGAGKSTLAKILAGVYPHGAYEGKILYNGDEIKFPDVLSAEHAGIGIVHQELNQFTNITVAENIFMCSMPHKYGIVDKKTMFDEAQKLVDSFNIGVSAKQLLSELSISKRQMIEIIKAVNRNCKVIIFDEATSSLTKGEVENLFVLINNLKKKNMTMIYVSHKLNEIFEICDDIVVLKDGEYVNSAPISEVDNDILVSWMIGRELKNMFPERNAKSAPMETVLEIQNWNVYRGSKKIINDVSFQLGKGEIIGFYGLVGAGRTELMESIFCGKDIRSEGNLLLNGQPAKINNTADAIKAKIGMLTDDRKLTGLVLTQNVLENAALASLNTFAPRFRVIDKHLLTKEVSKITKKLRLKVPNLTYSVLKLSGGNQQKVVLCKWLLSRSEIMILDEPTRGIDVGAKMEIYFMLRALADEGVSLIVISSELVELIGVCDRIYAMRMGEIVYCFDHEEFDEEKLVKAAM